MITGPEHLNDVSAYTPGASVEEIRRTYGLDRLEKLASNENPFGPSAKALEAASKALQFAHRYNDGGRELREALSSYHAVSADGIAVNNGSDALIHQILHTFLLPGETALSCEGGFVSFGIAVQSAGRQPRYVAQTADYRFDVEALAASIDSSTKVVYLPNPNNPTGTHVSRHELVYLVERLRPHTLLVIDEAYVEYASAMVPDTYGTGLELEHPNVLTLRTFSKAYGLAAMRVGYAVGHPNVVRWLHKTKLPFDPNGIGCAAAIAALSDQDHVRMTVQHTVQGMGLLQSTARESGYVTSNSVANFVFVDAGDSNVASSLFTTLLSRGFITRPLSGFGLPHCLRISIGTPEQNERLAVALAELSESFVHQ